MNVSIHRKKALENEAVFRNANERVKKGFDHIRQIAKEDKQQGILENYYDVPLHFYCECSDENCRKRIETTLHYYTKIHADRRKFIVISGHEVKDLEKIVTRHEKYNVVAKADNPGELPQQLADSGVDNSNK